MKRNKVLALVVLVAVILFSSACPDKDVGYWDSAITIKNNSTKLILRYFNFYSYPDTNLTIDNPFLDPRQLELASIEPNDSLVQEDAWLKYFEKNASIKLMLFLVDKQKIETSPWGTVRKNSDILKRYDLSLSDLENMNWTITYP